MNDNVEIIRSNKGGMKIIHRGYMYTVHKKRQGGGIRWRCTQRSLHCKGSISTGNGPPSVNMPHNHIPDPHSVALARCRQLEEFPDINSLLETEYDDIKVSTQVSIRETNLTKMSGGHSSAGRKRDPIWVNFHNKKSLKTGTRAICKKCGVEMQGLVERLKKHLAKCPRTFVINGVNETSGTSTNIVLDSMPLQQRMLLNAPPPKVQIPSSSESLLQSQPLSPTKLKVTRQVNKPQTLPTPKVIETPPEEVCLRWNSHHSNMQTTFPQLLEKEQYVDVTIIAEGKTLKCHRMILSSCSTYFEEILNDITPLQHPVIILKGIPFWILKALLDFMYVGEVNIDQNKLPELLDVAELLKVKGLAGKSNNADKNDKPDNQPAKKQQLKNNSGRQGQQIPRNLPLPQPPAIITKIEEMPISDPLELLEPKFQEDSDGTSSRIKENKSPTKKNFTKKFRKRKTSEDEPAPPLFPMRRGTRSRPNVKIPKYYDYEDIVKPTGSDIQPFSPVVNIKSEPIDVDENYAYNESVDTDMENMAIKHSFLSSVGVNPKTVENNMANKELTPRSRSVSRDKEQPPPMYKIKVKRFSSLSENTNYAISNNDHEKSSENNTSVSNELVPNFVTPDDSGEMCNTNNSAEIECLMTDTKSTEVVDEHIAQNDSNPDVDPLDNTDDSKMESSLIEMSNTEMEKFSDSGIGIINK